MVQIEHPSADYLLWLGTSDLNGHQLFGAAPQAAFALSCRTRDWKRVGSQTSNGAATVDDYNTRALVIAARHAFSRLPHGASVHILTDQKWFSDMLNDDRSVRIARDYRRSSGRSKYSYESEWRELDAVSEDLALQTSSGLPVTPAGKKELSDVKEAASQCARNIGRPHSDWDL